MGHIFTPGSVTETQIVPSAELDVEVEMAFFVGAPSPQFKRIPVTAAEKHIFGVVMLNDWSSMLYLSNSKEDRLLIETFTARDIQRTEDFPFAAFNAKNFASTISPWVVTLDALEPFRIKPQARVESDVLPYLADPNDSTYDIKIQMDWKLAGTKETFTTTKTKLSNAYWTFKQMVI
jgi:fumarylacetoacetase